MRYFMRQESVSIPNRPTAQSPNRPLVHTGSYAQLITPIAVQVKPISGAHQTGARKSANVRNAPNAVKIGQYDGGGMCIGSSGPCAAAHTASFSTHSGSRLRMVGIRLKLCSAGGDVVAHSSVADPHGLEPAGAPVRRLFTRL